MCGIAGIFGQNWKVPNLHSMIESQIHRGPDREGIFVDPNGNAGLGHNRLSIIDLSENASQPMTDSSGRYKIVFNGEIYNYLELKQELEGGYTFQTKSDTEVLLAAYLKWGEGCLDHLIGMFALIIWDSAEDRALVARDRFGVKPIYYHQKPDGTLLVASEIKALHAAGVTKKADDKTWATYLKFGLYDHSDRTFWSDIRALPAGHKMTWNSGNTNIFRWYDVAEKVGDDFDRRDEEVVREEYFELMKESVKMRFRSDVPVGINLSGGLDSSSLLGLVHEVQGKESDVKAFTFTTGDKNYDELPWVEEMLAETNHELVVSRLTVDEVPSLAAKVKSAQDEPFGGLPTLAYAKLFETARNNGVIVLLDGNGMDEQWAGYDYYESALNGGSPSLVQGTREKPVRPDCLDPEFSSLAEPLQFPNVFSDKMRNLQYRDTRFTKIPRAMRFNDRISMLSSTELREPFLDHRLFELAFRQPIDRKIKDGVHKKMLREISGNFLPEALSGSPKRSMQTPQREWLRGELSEWADEHINKAVNGRFASWFKKGKVLEKWHKFRHGEGDNSFFIWQWIDLGMRQQDMRKDKKI